jgi:SAM-dependent methyltransferase
VAELTEGRTRRVDFSQGARVYDRRHGARLPRALAETLVCAGRLTAGDRIIEVAAGTGRVALALADLGFRVAAVEPSREMLDQLVTKRGALKCPPVVAVGSSLPFAGATFGAAVIARALYLMPDWRAVVRETLRILRPDGWFLHEWGNGSADEEWVQVRERARTLFEEAGVTAPFHPGVRTEGAVDDELREQGWVRRSTVRTDGGAELTLGEFLARIVRGECSYTWDVPPDVQARCLPELEAWARSRFDLGRLQAIPRESSWAIYQRAVRS